MIRTPDRALRRRMLYPTELPGQHKYTSTFFILRARFVPIISNFLRPLWDGVKLEGEKQQRKISELERGEHDGYVDGSRRIYF